MNSLSQVGEQSGTCGPEIGAGVSALAVSALPGDHPNQKEEEEERVKEKGNESFWWLQQQQLFTDSAQLLPFFRFHWPDAMTNSFHSLPPSLLVRPSSFVFNGSCCLKNRSRITEHL